MAFNELEQLLIHLLKNEYRYRKLLESDKSKFNDKKYYARCQQEAEDNIKKLLLDHEYILGELGELLDSVTDFLVYTNLSQKNTYHNLFLDLKKYKQNYKLEIRTDKIYEYLRHLELIDDKYWRKLNKIN